MVLFINKKFKQVAIQQQNEIYFLNSKVWLFIEMQKIRIKRSKMIIVTVDVKFKLFSDVTQKNKCFNVIPMFLI